LILSDPAAGGSAKHGLAMFEIILTGGKRMERLFTKFANSIAHVSGRPISFITCLAVVLIWAVSGPIFGFSDTWQLVINTSTTIVTFLMVFLIQNTQNRDAAAIQAKLDELIRVGTGENQFIGIEHLTSAEVEEFRTRCERAAAGMINKSKAKTEARAVRSH
jgi:low affinity Fe/Cu permease